MKFLFMSVVIITYNGQATIGRAIDSVQAQDYPKNSYEVIVVDDGSKDSSPDIVKTYKNVRYIRLTPNRGIPGARNAGMKAAKGDIYVAFDDDCAAEPNWLRQISMIYQTSELPPGGVGGELVDPQSPNGLSDLYICARDNDTSRIKDKNKAVKHTGFFIRLFRYFMQRPGSFNITRTNQPVVVEELYGANSSFPMDILKAVGGWREGMNSIEDRDICRSIKEAYPAQQFIVNPAAKIVHDRGQTLSQYLHRQYKQGPYNLFFYLIHKQFPPLFPLPIIYLLLCIIAVTVNFLFMVLIVVLSPLLLYYWWPLQAVRQHEARLLSFAYIQLSEEVIVIMGLLRGLIWRIRHKGIYA